MPQTVILQLPGGPVPAYALQLMDRLKENGIADVLIDFVKERLPAPAHFPSNWQPPSTLNTNWEPPAYSVKYSLENTIVVQLGTESDQNSKDGSRLIIRCSLFEDAVGPCFPEIIRAMMKGEGYCAFNVVAKDTTSGQAHVLKGCSKIISHSYQQSLELAIESAIGLVEQQIAQIESGIARPYAEVGQPFFETKNKLNPSTFISVSRNVRWAKIKKRFQQSLFIERWNIGIIDAPIQEVALSKAKKWNVKWLQEEKGSDFRADPFGMSNALGTHLVYEHMHNSRGQINVLQEEVREKVLIGNTSHLSYPYTFTSDGTTYIVPECSELEGLRIYPIEPKSLQPGIPIDLRIGLQVVDPSITHHGGFWWIFCTDRFRKGADMRLHIFFADQLTGPWKPHPMNPVKTDIRSARPAGHLFTHNGSLFRPSQDSSKTYGGRIIVNRIDELNPERFSETAVNIVSPELFTGPYRLGIHTISAFGDKTCIDGKRSVFHPFAFQRYFP